MKNFLITQLQKLARRTLDVGKPIIVGVTGSVGKTTTRQAIALALQGTFNVRSSEKNYNNELGMPLTILGEESPGKNILAWVKIFWRGLRKSNSAYPELLVLEYGADKPGDIRALCNVARPRVSVITAISPVHAANYPNIDALVDEKATLGTMTEEDGLVVLNIDDPRVAEMAQRMTAPVVTYSVTKPADVRAKEIRVDVRRSGNTFVTTTARIATRRGETTVALTNCIGASAVAACTAAVAVGEFFNIPLSVVTERVSSAMRPVPGRLCPLLGVHDTLILDDTYNAAPASMHTGLAALALFTPANGYTRRIAVLGKMAELGQYSDAAHSEIGTHVAEVAQIFVAVGTEMRAAVESARKHGMAHDCVEWFASPEAAARYVQKILTKGDVVFVKGSQSARMEKVIPPILAHPAEAEAMLVRQSAYWKTH